MAKTRKQFESGVKDLKEFWESKIDKHMQEVEKKSKPTLVGVVSAIVLQIIALGFANCIIWIAKPSSSKKYIIILHPFLHEMQILCKFSMALY